jgi:hypothetical protein
MNATELLERLEQSWLIPPRAPKRDEGPVEWVRERCRQVEEAWAESGAHVSELLLYASSKLWKTLTVEPYTLDAVNIEIRLGVPTWMLLLPTLEHDEFYLQADCREIPDGKSLTLKPVLGYALESPRPQSELLTRWTLEAIDHWDPAEARAASARL